MKTKTQLQVALDSARYELGEAIERVKELRMKVANLRLDVAAERAYQKSTRQMLRAQKRLERIAKTEARLEAMRLKALSPKQTRKSQQKAGPVKVWSAEEIASFEAARHG